MQQIVMNLITNAAEAIGERPGIIMLSTGLVDYSTEDLRRSKIPETPAPGRFIFIEVKDTGCGMSSGTQEKMFDPFFTTKFTGRGLGMSAALGIVKGHKGAIFVQSEPETGTTIRVAFPATTPDLSAPLSAPGMSGTPSEIAPVTGTILVVDDEDLVLDLGREIIEELGFRSLCAADGEEAIAIFSERSDEIVCVLLDLTMPKKDGVETFKKLNEIRPGIPVILSSGYSEHEVAERFRGAGLSGFIQKPYRFVDLKTKLIQVLRSQQQ
jgi:CheY-like chemotaxis protein